MRPSSGSHHCGAARLAAAINKLYLYIKVKHAPACSKGSCLHGVVFTVLTPKTPGEFPIHAAVSPCPRRDLTGEWERSNNSMGTIQKSAESDAGRNREEAPHEVGIDWRKLYRGEPHDPRHPGAGRRDRLGAELACGPRGVLCRRT